MVAVPPATGTVSVWSPTVNTTSPAASAGVIFAVARTVSPAMISTSLRSRFVWVASLWMETVPLREEPFHWLELAGMNVAVTDLEPVVEKEVVVVATPLMTFAVRV